MCVWGLFSWEPSGLWLHNKRLKKRGAGITKFPSLYWLKQIINLSGASVSKSWETRGFWHCLVIGSRSADACCGRINARTYTVTFPNCVSEIHWQLCVAFLTPLTPGLYDEVGKQRAVSLRQSLDLYGKLQQKQMESSFRPLQRGLVYSNIILVYSDTHYLLFHWNSIWGLWDAPLVFDARRYSESDKNMWDFPISEQLPQEYNAADES